MNENHVHEQGDWERRAYERLVVGIVERTVQDYKAAVQRLKTDPKDLESRITKQECECFFLSPWFVLLTNLDGKQFLNRIHQEIVRTKPCPTGRALEKICPLCQKCEKYIPPDDEQKQRPKRAYRRKASLGQQNNLSGYSAGEAACHMQTSAEE